MNPLEQARTVVAAYWNLIGFPNDAKAVLAGQSDYSADVQCVLASLIMQEYGIPANSAAVAASSYPHEHGSTSRNHREENKHATSPAS